MRAKNQRRVMGRERMIQRVKAMGRLVVSAALFATPASSQDSTDTWRGLVVAPAHRCSRALALYDDNSNGRITCKEARGHGIAPVSRDHPAYRFKDDRDGDGMVCE